MAGGLATASGTGTSNTQFNQNTQQSPWAPIIGGLLGGAAPPTILPNGQDSVANQGLYDRVLNNIDAQLGGPSNVQNEALLQGNLDSGLGGYTPQLPNFGPAAGKVAGDLLSNSSPINSPLMKYLDPNYLNPMTAPGMQPYLQSLQNQITNNVNGMFASAGRSLSPANSTALAYGLTSGMAPTILGQYNTDVGQQMAAINALRTNYGAGLGAAAAQPQLQMLPSQTMLQQANQDTYLPVQDTALAESLLMPFAGLGGQTNTQGTSATQTATTSTPSVLSQIGQISGLFGGGGGIGNLIGAGSSAAS